MDILKIGSKSNIFSSLYFLFFLSLPLVYSKGIIDPTLIPRQIFLTVFTFLIGIVIIHQIYFKKLQFEFSFLKTSISVALMIFLATIFISFKQANILSESVYVLSKTAIVLLFFIITTYLLVQKKITTMQITNSIVVFVIITLCISSYQIIKLERAVTEVTATMANKNLLSSILFLCFPFLINSMVGSKQRKIYSFCLILLTITTLWIVQTKAVLIPLLIFGLVIIVFKIFRHRKKTSKSTKLSVLIVSCFFIIMSVVTIQNESWFSQRYNTNTIHTRVLLWDNTEQMIQENVVFGVGAGNWKNNFSKYGLENFGNEVKNGRMIYQRPHNDFLWFFSELGILGFLSYGSLFFLALFYLFRIIKRSVDWQQESFFLTLFLCVLGFVFISSVDFPMERIEHQTLLFLIFSIITAKYYAAFKEQKHSNNKKIVMPLMLVGGIGAIALSFVVSTKRYAGEQNMVHIYDAHRKENWTELIQIVDSTINPYYKIDPMSVPLQWFKGVALFSLGNFDKAKENFEEAKDLTPYNIHILNNLASCFEKLGDHNTAIEYYQRAISISPGFEESLLNLSAVYYNIGQYEKAFDAIDKCSVNSVDPKYKAFLPIILKSKLETIQLRDGKVAGRNSSFASEELLEMYFDSKKGKGTFENHLKNHLK